MWSYNLGIRDKCLFYYLVHKCYGCDAEEYSYSVASKWSTRKMVRVVRTIVVLVTVFLCSNYRALAVVRKDFYPFNLPSSQTLKSEPNGQISSADIKLRTPIVFYDRNFTSVYVSINQNIPKIVPNLKCFILKFKFEYLKTISLLLRNFHMIRSFYGVRRDVILQKKTMFRQLCRI